ncbi:MAG TPA: hypothetical protein VKE94_18275, partial [Gemmataceae bacterium]|nr:hypothetical protein [Gemmataceae bacterium]
GEHGLFKDKRGKGNRVTKTKVTQTVRLRARAGYAVGSITVRSGLNINGLCVTYMRVDGTLLDPDRSYTSEWVGDRTGGSEATVSGGGDPIVGIFGNEDAEHVMALGLIFVQRLGQPAPAAEAPRLQPAPKAAARAPQPAPDAPAAANPPPVQQPDAPPEAIKDRLIDKYIDHENHFSLTVPEGWQRMFRSERDAIAAVLRQRQLDKIVQYDMGFRPNGSAKGTLPYVLIQVHPMDTAGLTYQEIQDQLDMGLEGPMKFAEGKFSDVLSDLSVGKPILERARNRFILRLQSEVFGVGKVEGFSVTHLGAKAVVSVHCYGKAETFARLMPTYTDMNNSFFFDDGYDFVPKKESSEGTNWTTLFVLLGVSVGLGLGFLAFVGRNWLARPTVGGWSPLDKAPVAPIVPLQSTAIRTEPSAAAPALPPVLGADDLVK